MTATDLLRTPPRRRAERRTRYRIFQETVPDRTYMWYALAVRVPVSLDGRPLRSISPAVVGVSDVQWSGPVRSWDEAAAWCDAHHRGLL